MKGGDGKGPTYLGADRAAVGPRLLCCVTTRRAPFEEGSESKSARACGPSSRGAGTPVRYARRRAGEARPEGPRRRSRRLGPGLLK